MCMVLERRGSPVRSELIRHSQGGWPGLVRSCGGHKDAARSHRILQTATFSVISVVA